MDTVFFILSKTAGMVVRVEIWLLLVLTASLFALWRGRIRRAKLLLSALTLFVLVLSYHPIGIGAFARLESRYPVEPVLNDVDGIIILGGAEQRGAMQKWGPVQLSAAAERYTVALELANQFPQAKVLFTGGSGHIGDLRGINASESTVAEHFLLEHGVDSTRILLEGKSRNTAENAAFGLKVAEPKQDETWVLITSAYHLPRAVRSFANAGWPDVVPYPVDFRTANTGAGFRPYLHLANNMELLNILLKEHLGTLVYRLTER